MTQRRNEPANPIMNEERLKDFFAQARTKSSRAERKKYLAEVCQDEPELLREVESLLRAEEQAGDFLGRTMHLTASGCAIEPTAGSNPE